MNKHANLPSPALIIIRGLPGSGKSYLAAALENSIGKEHVLVVDPDNVDTSDQEYKAFTNELAKEGLDKKIHPFRWSRKLARDAISENKIVIWNQPFTDRGIFERLVAYLQNYASEHALSLPVLLVEIEIEHTAAKKRLNERKQAGGHGPSDETFANRVSEYASYANDYNTVTVHGENGIDLSVETVIKALQELYDPHT